VHRFPPPRQAAKSKNNCMTTPTENKLIVADVNQCLANYTLTYSPTFDFNDFRTPLQTITNYLATSKLSDIILKNYFPQNPITEYHHFTDIDAFENILATKKLWLFSVKKRFSEDEFKPFYTAHKMDGYELRKNSVGVALENELVENAFYTSFTNTKLSSTAEDYMWEYFAKETGVRLVFEVVNLNTDLRQVYYPQTSTRSDIPLLTDLIEIAKKRNKFLIISRIATIGFFYLPHKYCIEQEFRLLVKRETGKYFNLSFGSKAGFDYLEFPFNQTNPIAEFRLKKIIFDTKTDVKRAEQIIKSNADFSKIPIENNYR
jgi:hypothetical protein